MGFGSWEVDEGGFLASTLAVHIVGLCYISESEAGTKLQNEYSGIDWLINFNSKWG